MTTVQTSACAWNILEEKTTLYSLLEYSMHMQMWYSQVEYCAAISATLSTEVYVSEQSSGAMPSLTLSGRVGEICYEAPLAGAVALKDNPELINL